MQQNSNGMLDVLCIELLVVCLHMVLVLLILFALNQWGLLVRELARSAMVFVLLSDVGILGMLGFTCLVRAVISLSSAMKEIKYETER
ncbi:hypothetical protein [Pseudomonas aeruginosa]|uniref:hypothetical protein n=1 Tax=Pseudomonas aeruginosa TaxID=287 RepID=UPI00106B56C8|nr:hypothetical protein [Pseudomonas aeruginosa]